VDARHAVFIMTSNIGTEETGKSLGFVSDPNQQPDYEGFLDRFFRPEFLNRVDEVITFRPLNRDIMSSILDLQLEDLHQRLARQHLKLILSDEARSLVLRKGYDPINGARPLRRAIERLVTRPLSAKIVEDAFQAGDDIVAKPDGDDRLKFEPQRG
jgi:ATP-dependent Clp protease ATP-binding subunit ClpC